MKKIILLFFIFLFLYGCITEKDLKKEHIKEKELIYNIVENIYDNNKSITELISDCKNYCNPLAYTVIPKSNSNKIICKCGT